MEPLFHRTAHSAVRHHGGGGVILGGIGAVLLFVSFAVMLAAQSLDWEPLLIGISLGVSTVLFGVVFHFTH
ncbi:MULTISPECIES: hypothetical protein [Glutamicibacter]|jgi:hypothetical protein|uniref:Uncharacterized protein n=1 Tax=Glutamicibacter arilaitensis TaxID=256701 RepID=A0A4Y8TS78_9MICC|nr:hypothetical protein [Glutamicibacter arilaitensis]TFH54791.1 hypothetical protein EXY26_12440 [Glutamicibacter arilaitensis]